MDGQPAPPAHHRAQARPAALDRLRAIVADRALARYRALGADLPFADLRRARAATIDGWFWRFTDVGSGRVVIALCGVSRDRSGQSWANVALAAQPSGALHAADLPRVDADTAAYRIDAGEGTLCADAGSLAVDLGPHARLEASFTERREWARPPLGGCGAAHLLPGLGQYWHPHLFGARVSGSARLGPETLDLSGWAVYAERNWGGAGFPPRWWWGQAQGFDDPELCVAFAGGDVVVGRARLEATALVMRFRGETLRLGNPLLAPGRAQVGGGRWSLRARGLRYAIEIEGVADADDVHVLPVPLPAERYSVPAAHQHLRGRMRIVVRRRGRIVYAGESRLAGFERGELSAARPADTETHGR